MGQLAFGVVGAVVGTVISPGTGTYWGWAIGSAIGGVVFAPDGPQTTGPRLEDLKSNVSTYGQPIPRCYGQIGFMGSLIWMDDITETTNVEEQGKGGDPASQTTFSYSASFAMILCRGEVSTIPNSVPVKALNRIWVNEKCYYDVRDQTNAAAMVASANFARYFTFYYGTQTQEPDPTMEAVLGVGNVPAYRGRSYCVFTDLPLGFFQNQPPGALRITFEVVMEGAELTGLRFVQTTPGASAPGGAQPILYPVDSGLLRIGTPIHANGVNMYTMEGVFLGSEALTEEEAEWPPITTASVGDNTFAIGRTYDAGAVRAYFSNVTFGNVVMRLYTLTQDLGTVSAVDLFPAGRYYRGVAPSVDQRHFIVFSSTGAANAIDEFYLIQWLGDEWEIVQTGTVTTNFPFALPGVIGQSGQGEWKAGMLEEDLRHFWILSTNGNIGYELFYIDDFGELDIVDSIFEFHALGVAPATLQVTNGMAYGLSSTWIAIATRNVGGASNGQTLQQVVEAECSLAGLDVATQVDASDLAPFIVDGMFVRRLGATRGVLGVLQPAYFFDTYESSGQLKTKLRGSPTVVTIDEDELGASIDGEAEADLINPERAEEDTLPGECIVTYLDRASDYQVAAQHDRRSAVETEQPVNLEMPLVLTPDDARQIAGVWMYNQWAGRTRRTVRLSRKYSYLEPTDVFVLRTSIAEFTVRATAIKTNEGFLEVECVDEEVALYDQNAQGANIDQGTVITLATPTKLVLLDIPMLRETDDNAGFYVAASGYGAGWPGASILRSTNGGVTYSPVATFITPTVMGNVPLALGNYTGPLGYDAVNQISVSLFGIGTLQSVTDAELLAGANAFALGSPTTGYEIIQFKTATLVSGTTYLLSQLVRGRRGTEHEMAGHGAQETFVLLDASTMRRIGIDTPAIGVENHYKAVTYGQFAQDATVHSFTNTAAGLKPYSPVNGLGTGFGGDITITWTRRGRIYNDWRDAVELPLGEVSEAYVVEIWNAGNTSVLRTISGITSPTTTYTSANQITDFGSNPSSLNVRIYQISAIVGRGFPLIATLS